MEEQGRLESFPLMCIGSGECRLQCTLVNGKSSIGCSFVDLKVIMNYVISLEKKALKVLKQVPARMLRWLSGEGRLAMCLRVSIDSHLRVSIH